MKTNLQSISINRLGLRRFRISVRGLVAFFVLISLLMVAIQLGWPRRTVSSLLTIPTIDVQVFEPHLHAIAKSSDSIIELRIDRRINSIIVTAQARHIDAARSEVERLIADPHPAFAASSLGITLQESQDLLSGL